MNKVIIETFKRVRGGKYRIEGHIYGKVGELSLVSKLDTYKVNDMSRTDLPTGAYGFWVDFTLCRGVINFAIKDNKNKTSLETAIFSRITPLLLSRSVLGDFIIIKLPNSLLLVRYNLMIHMVTVIPHTVSIFFNWRIGKAMKVLAKVRSDYSIKNKVRLLLKSVAIVAEAIVTVPGSLMVRLIYFIYRQMSLDDKEVWLVSDRPMSGGDNGESLFRYISSLENVPARVYYVISKRSHDYKRLKREFTNVIKFGGIKHKILFLHSSKIISSQADIEVYNLFRHHGARFWDLYKFEFVFLQHGIIRHDHSGWLGRFSKGIDLFITSAQQEYDSVMEYPYHYSADSVVITGLARYDELTSDPRNKLIIAPTYRANLLKGDTNRRGERRYNKLFKQSHYYNFYNNLMNDPRILRTLKTFKYSGEFYLHPNLAAQLVDFTENPYIKVKNYPYDYKSAFKYGSLIVSDYSSIVFDFAYLYKPVIYSQFDYSSFFSDHTYDEGGFFSDCDDGFGPVCSDYETTVDQIINTIKNQSLMSLKYKKRVDAFFNYHDNKNCARIYELLVKKKE